ncbi:MAG: dihydropteroate synthase [Gammaproteobacteria bacterium]|nr:dihydropteroate synthase [Gammaproteobacteria bacterium]
MSLILTSNKKPIIMGILNVTPDSFFDGGLYLKKSKALKRVKKMINDGVDIIDIGAESSRPGSLQISSDEEIARLSPIIREIRNYTDIPISIDTRKSDVIEELLKYKIQLINDISSLSDINLIPLIKKHNLFICLMHMQGNPATMQNNPKYKNIITDISAFFKKKLNLCIKNKIKKDRIIIDPGFGFGKTLNHNYQILKNLEHFKKIHKNLLIGISRKSMIGDLLKKDPEDRLYGTLTATILSIKNGASIIRTHDVRQTKLLLDMKPVF